MKGAFFLLVLLIGQSAYAQKTPHRQLEVIQAEPKQKHCVEIPVTFSHERISESNALNRLQTKKINRVELIYTRYKENADFNQDQLNEDRMFRLHQILPKLQTDRPEIVWIEQTGATTREEASNYFHGFRLYTEEQQKEVFQRNSREDHGNPALVLTVDNTKGGIFSHASGSRIHIPSNAVAYSNGKPVIGNYTITYREYRDPAQIAFSGIPMEFQDKTGAYLFNSAGMYEIRGTKEGKELVLQNDIVVDFNCTKKEAGVNFYEMDDRTGEWKLLKSELFGFGQNRNTAAIAKSEVKIPAGALNTAEHRYKKGIAPEAYGTADNTADSIRIEGNVKGHQFPTLVTGLNSPKFGVYNCDQVYRLANKTVISPKYVDVSSKKQIKDLDMVCLIDKAVNASFSFGPRQITCNAKGDNVFLLFTGNGEIYALKSEKDQRIDLTQKEPEFLMERITDKVKSSADLKRYLSI